MCVVSMIGDVYKDKWTEWEKYTYTYPAKQVNFDSATFLPKKESEELETLKREVAALRLLLKAALQYDLDNGEEDCEVEEKMIFLKRVARLVGVDLSDILG